jgi:hypothetical protein
LALERAVPVRAGLAGASRRRVGLTASPAVGCGQDRDDGQHGDDEGGRSPAGELVEVAGQHLHRDARQDDGQARLQVAELSRRPGEQEVQRPHSQQGEHVRGVDNEGVGRDREDRGDRVDSEDHVRGLDHDQGEQQRGGQRAAPFADEKPLTVQPVGRGQDPAECPQHTAVPRLDVATAARHLDRGEHQHGAEDIADRVELIQQRDTRHDERAAHDQRPDDAQHEDAVLVAQRDRERREDDGEHEHVVQRQALLDQVAEQVGLRDTAASPGPQDAAEAQADRHPDGAPDRGFFQRHLPGPRVQHEQVHGEHRDDERGERHPRP